MEKFEKGNSFDIMFNGFDQKRVLTYLSVSSIPLVMVCVGDVGKFFYIFGILVAVVCVLVLQNTGCESKAQKKTLRCDRKIVDHRIHLCCNKSCDSVRASSSILSGFYRRYDLLLKR